MGTSINQRSPDTTNWRIVQSAYEDPSVPLPRVLQEIWRAAANQPEGDIIRQLANPNIGSFVSFAISATSPAEVAHVMGRFIAETKSASLAADIARRAVMQSVGHENPSSVFVQR